MKYRLINMFHVYFCDSNIYIFSQTTMYEYKNKKDKAEESLLQK